MTYCVQNAGLLREAQEGDVGEAGEDGQVGERGRRRSAGTLVA